jgi:hypothetical protein
LPEVDLLNVKKTMGDISKLSNNDDIKIHWDNNHMVTIECQWFCTTGRYL